MAARDVRTGDGKYLLSAGALSGGHCFTSGLMPFESGPIPTIPREQWVAEIEKMRAEEAEWWDGKVTAAEVVVELPFWLMIPDCLVTVPYEQCSVTASVNGHYIEIVDGPYSFDSRAGVIFVGSQAEVTASSVRRIIAGSKRPTFRPMKTAVAFEAAVLVNALESWRDRASVTAHDRAGVRAINRANDYFRSVAFGHLPLLNRLITSYRSVSHDPFAFEVGEWDTPVWYIKSCGMLVRTGLMPYWDSDAYPELREFSGSKAEFYAASPEAVQSQAKATVAPGKLELLDALSHSFRGRFGDAIRSAVTAIEVALEAQLVKLFKTHSLSDEQVERRLSESRGSFHDRLREYERLSGRRLPGPLVSIMPYINGIYLESELEWVRRLRHRIVHDGIRVDIFSRGTANRAIETLTWLFQWLSPEDDFKVTGNKNYALFCMLRGDVRNRIEFTADGVVVGPHPAPGPETRVTTDALFEQYVASIGERAPDLALFARMTFEYLGIECADAPPPSADEQIPRERYHIRRNDQCAIVICLELDGLIGSENAAGVAARALAAQQLKGRPLNTLCILNHQRHIPPELRETGRAIPDSVDGIFRECGMTIITAIDLQRLVRGVLEHKWNPISVGDLLLIPGRQGERPPEYEKVGIYMRSYPKHSVLSIQLDVGVSIRLGDTLGVRLADRYHEDVITSLQVNRQPVNSAAGPLRVGVVTTAGKAPLRSGSPVFVRRAAGKEPG